METSGERWKAAFMDIVQYHENTLPLREASLNGNLKNWTTELTFIASSGCNSATGKKLKKLLLLSDI